MALCYNAYLLTLLIPPAILTFINAELGPDPRYTWITISWNLGGAIFVTVGGRLSDIFGRRWFFISGNVLLIIGAIISATGKSIPQMIAGGAIFGAGSGFMEMSFGAIQVGSPACLRLFGSNYLGVSCADIGQKETVPNEWRPFMIGVFDAS